MVSLVTVQSLNSSLMSSLDQQLQTATHTWYSCVQSSTNNGRDHDGQAGSRRRTDGLRVR